MGAILKYDFQTRKQLHYSEKISNNIKTHNFAWWQSHFLYSKGKQGQAVVMLNYFHWRYPIKWSLSYRRTKNLLSDRFDFEYTFDINPFHIFIIKPFGQLQLKICAWHTSFSFGVTIFLLNLRICITCLLCR